MKKTVLITGAYGGMGSAMTEALLSMGYRVFALDKKIREGSENLIPIEADLTDEKSVISAFESVASATDNLDAIIHFAGVYRLDSLVEMTSGEFESAFKINLNSCFLVNKTFLPLLKSGSRIIITTSELASLDPLPFTGIYAITKAALDKYAYSLRMELQLLGIDVCVIRAGAVDTGMLGASITALNRFHEKTRLYSCNAARFKSIVEGVEARSIPASALAKRVLRVMKKRRTRFAYSINRNPLLLLLNILPKGMQLFAIKQVLKSGK